MECILYITPAGNIQLTDDVQCRGTKHLVFFVPQCLGGSYYDAVSGVNPNRINILHITYCDAVSGTVTHYFIFNFFPTGDAPLYKHLADAGETKTIFQNFYQFFFIAGNPAAASSQGIGRTKHYRVAYGIGKRHAVRYIFYHKRGRHRLSNLFHCTFKLKAVFCLFYCF